VTLASIIAAIIATYAAIVSTRSLALAKKAYRAADPYVELDWKYTQDDRNLSLSIMNPGQADVTITAIDLYVVHEVITNQSLNGKRFGVLIDPIDEISHGLWLPAFPDFTFRQGSSLIRSYR
jgi:hypothetical protein